MAADVAAGGEPVHQFNRTVMLNLKAIGEISYSWSRSAWQSLQSEHELVLARLDPGRVRSLLAEMNKAADLVAQLCQRLVVSLSQRALHKNSIS